MQRLISHVVWGDEQMRWTSHHVVHDDLGAPEGVVIVDEAGVPTKGQDSGGVARQYWGSLGKVANGRVWGFAASTSPRGDALLDQRPVLPAAWLTDASATRRAQCQVPLDVTLHTTSQ
jgi:SRSO17 transposase